MSGSKNIRFYVCGKVIYVLSNHLLFKVEQLDKNLYYVCISGGCFEVLCTIEEMLLFFKSRTNSV